MSTGPHKRRELVFREDWEAIPAERPITQRHVSHRDLVLALHGPGGNQVKKSHHEHIDGDPYYVWSGKCEGAWALTFRHRRMMIDLSLDGLVRWRARQSGSHRLRLVVKPEGRPWLVSEMSDDASPSWREFEIDVAATSWRRFDIETCTACATVAGGEIVDAEPALAGNVCAFDPGLARIEAVGVTDLMPGGGSDNCSRLDWIEVWGRSVARTLP